MSANVETMFSVREKPWHGLGTIVEEAPTSTEAIKLAGLDWNVISTDVIVNGKIAENYKANVRSSDNKLLGIVGNKYSIVQNSEAFTFTDNLVNEGMKYETAGSLKDGKRIWLLGKLPAEKILDDEVIPYVCFTNTHDGSGAVKVIMTPVRVVCNNTLNLALEKAKRSWSTRHIGNINDRLDEAKRTLELSNNYMKELSTVADEFANSKITEEQFTKITEELFPIVTEDTDRKKANMKQCRDNFTACYFAPDIAKFMNTKWGVINAATDFVDHITPNRKTESYQENNWGRIMDGHIIVDTTMLKLLAMSKN